MTRVVSCAARSAHHGSPSVVSSCVSGLVSLGATHSWRTPVTKNISNTRTHTKERASEQARRSENVCGCMIVSKRRSKQAYVYAYARALVCVRVYVALKTRIGVPHTEGHKEPGWDGRKAHTQDFPALQTMRIKKLFGLGTHLSFTSAGEIPNTGIHRRLSQRLSWPLKSGTSTTSSDQSTTLRATALGFRSCSPPSLVSTHVLSLPPPPPLSSSPSSMPSCVSNKPPS